MKNKIGKLKILFLVMIGIALPLVTVNASEKQISNETMLEYYQKYLIIAEDISKATNIPIKLVPIEEMKQEDWITPEKFKQVVSTTAESMKATPATTAVVLAVSMPRFAGNATKNTAVLVNDGTYPISITGKFITQYHSTTSRQQLLSVSEIESAANGDHSWRQVSYDVTLIDGNRVAVIYVTGYVRPFGSSVEYKRTCNVEFYCSEKGSIG